MALNASRNTPYKDGHLLPFALAAGAKIYAGALVCLNAAGYLVPGSASPTLKYVGRADDFADNTAGADGQKVVTVRRRKAFKFVNSSVDPVAQVDLNNTVYIVDDQTVAKTNGTGTRSAAGRLVGIEPDGVWIE
ncbi:MAG: hypothetical protein M3Y65_22040 [Pseudomonadota bacterium]|nr:hypothetical protein [Pseudomonadota bacterium]